MYFLYQSLVDLIFPRTCLACYTVLVYEEQHLCTGCLATLPSAELSVPTVKATLMRKFYGLIPLRDIFSLYHFSSKGRVQQLLHSVKYGYQAKALLSLGHRLGEALHKRGYEAHIDLIVPVPLHPKRREIRGYNQSALLAQGISQTLQRPMHEDGLVRKVHTLTQTRQTRQQRWKNVCDAFVLTSAFAPKVQGKHILLVDDLVTTGATLAACAQHCIDASAASISMATLAMAIQG